MMEENKDTLDLGFAKLDLQRQQRCGFRKLCIVQERRRISRSRF